VGPGIRRTLLELIGWPTGLGAAAGAVGGGAIVHGGTGAIGTAIGVATGAAVGIGLAALVRWRAPVWVRVLVGVGVPVAVVVTVLLVVFGVIFESEGGAGEIPKQSTPDQKTRLTLEQEFAPVLRLNRSPRELFVPIGRPAYVALTQLEIRAGGTDRVKDPNPTIETLPTAACSLAPGCVYFLDVVGAEPDPPKDTALVYRALQEQALRRGARRVVYAHVTRYVDSGDYAVQYWFLYFFNYRLNEHESDWEQITIHLDPQKRPVNALYSAHVCAHTLGWKGIKKVDSTHPIDYVADGSHANYFKPGHASVGLKKIKLSKKQAVCVIERGFTDIADGRGIELRPKRDYELRELTGPLFSGSYGSFNYVLGKRKPDPLNDPRSRREWRDPLELLQKR
jgi:hypothetical protein